MLTLHIELIVSLTPLTCEQQTDKQPNVSESNTLQLSNLTHIECIGLRCAQKDGIISELYLFFLGVFLVRSMNASG